MIRRGMRLAELSAEPDRSGGLRQADQILMSLMRLSQSQRGQSWRSWRLDMAVLAKVFEKACRVTAC